MANTTSIALNVKKDDLICLAFYHRSSSFGYTNSTIIYSAGSQPNWYRGLRANSDGTVVLSFSEVTGTYWSQIR